MQSPPSPPRPAPNFLDAAARDHYLSSIQLAASCDTDQLLAIRDDLVRLLHLQPVRTDADSNQALYTAALLATVDDLLRTRPTADHDDSTIAIASEALRSNPIEWTAVRVLTEQPGGEQRLPLVLRVYDHFAELDETTGRRLLERVISAIGQTQQSATAGGPAQRLLDRIGRLPNLAAMRAAVERIVRLHRWPIGGALRVDHLLDMLLTPTSDLARHPIACLLYQRLVQVLRANRGCMAAFLQRLVPVLDDDRGCAQFQRCMQLQRLYETVAAALAQRLGAVRVLETGCEPDGYSLCVPVGDVGDKEASAAASQRWNLADVRRVCCCLLARRSPVRRRFAEHLAAVKMAGAVRKLVVTEAMLVYD